MYNIFNYPSDIHAMQFNELKATREGWGRGLVELGKIDERVVVLTADLKESTKVDEFAELFPDRFVECGVAEQNMMGVAAGLAAAGKRPFLASYAVFSPGRNWDQLRVSVCYSNLPVVIGGAHAGLSVGPDGATHQALEDIAMTRSLPNLTVVVPCDYWEAKKAVEATTIIDGPVYIRLTREKSAVMTEETDIFEIGRVGIMENYGYDAAIVGCGPVLELAKQAAEELKAGGINITVVNNHTIKPLDEKGILDVVEKCQAVVTVEEHQIFGGMGSAICELLAQKMPVPVEMVGVKDAFGESGNVTELWNKYGLSVEKIVAATKKVLERKASRQ